MYRIKYYYLCKWCIERVAGRKRAINRAQEVKRFGGRMVTIVPLTTVNSNEVVK